jgi:predicted amidohydrolase YtcJ
MAKAPLTVPGFVDHHAHLLRESSGIGFPAGPGAVREFHEQVARAGTTPMDVLDPPLPQVTPGQALADRAACRGIRGFAGGTGGRPPGQAQSLAGRLVAGLARAAAAGLVEVTEMGMRSWGFLDALAAAEQAGPLPARVRIYLASGLADEASLDELDARRTDTGPWVRLDGIKFYADGWLGPRTCALCEDFADTAGRGLLFTDAAGLARRIRPLAGRGWRIATHAIGDRGAQTVLDAYDLAFDNDQAELAAAAPRLEHASLLSAELIARMAETGVVAGIQPSFAVTDAGMLGPALGPERAATAAYAWTALAASGVPMLAGSDYPIEVFEPLVGLARLTAGRSSRPGFESADEAPAQAHLPASVAFAIMSDPAAGRTTLTADPRTATADEIDRIDVLGTDPVPFPAPR